MDNCLIREITNTDLENRKMKNGVNSKILENIFWMFTTGILALLVTIVIYELWNFDFTMPLCYTGDSCSSLNVAQNIIDGGWIYVNNRIAPLGAAYYTGAIGFILHAAILWVICIFTNSAAVAVNIFYLLCFSLIAMSAFVTLRMMKITKFVSLIGGILYTQLPYHYMRSEGHLWLSAYYMVPFACLVIYYLISGQLENIKNYKGVICILISVFMGCSDIYYSAFYLELCVCATVLHILRTKKIKSLCSFICIVASTGISLLATIFPMIFYTLTSEEEIPLANRAYGDVDIFGLKWIYLILPIQNHRIPVLSDFRKFCDKNFPNNNENGFVSLGVLLSFALIIAIFAVFVRQKEYNLLTLMGILIIVSIFLSGVGSLSTLVAALLTTSIRSCNRISIFIAMFADISLCYLLDYGKSRVISLGRKRYVLPVLGSLILCFGVWDVTSGDYAVYTSYDSFEHEWTESRDEEEARVKSDRSFFGEIQSQMNDDAMVLQLPIVSDTIYSSFPNGVAGTWTNFYPFFYTNLKWSHGDIKGGKTDKWLSRVKNLPLDRLIDVAVHVGFTGLYIDPAGYEEAELKDVVSVIKEKTGSTALRSEVGKLYFFDIQQYAQQMKKQVSPKKWSAEKDYWLYDFSGYYADELNADKLNYKEGQKFDKKENAILKKGNLQFGPYVQLPYGMYEVKVMGKGMENAIVQCTADSGKKKVPITILERTDTHITYCIKLKEKCELEFLTSSNGQGDVVLNRISYETLYDQPEHYEMEYKPFELQYENKQNFDQNGNAILQSGDLQYGPYLWLPAGNYEVILFGEKINDVLVKCTADLGKTDMPIEMVKAGEDQVVYHICLDKEYENIEFLAKNESKNEVILKALKYQSLEENGENK